MATVYTFQSTLSMRRATGRNINKIHKHIVFQSTLSMRRATNRARTPLIPTIISIHALHEESDR